MQTLLDTITKMGSIKEPLRTFLFLTSLITINLSFIPGSSSFVILMSYILQNYLHSILIQLCSSIVGASVTYFVSNRYLKVCLDKKFASSTLYKVAKKESQTHPWKLNLAFRFMYIPTTVQNVL